MGKVGGRLALLSSLALVLAGCATLRQQQTACRLASFFGGGALGALGGGLGVDRIESTPDEGEIAAGAAAGFVVGALAGMVLGELFCAPEPPPSLPEPIPPPPPPPPPPGAKIGEIAGPQFAFDDARLGSEGRARVEEAARLLRAHPGLRVSVEGHTDAVGSERYNQRLSERRARTVADHLIESGIDRERIEVRGFGMTRPVADNQTAEGRARNRRVEIIAR